jgi:hypothetical protein
VNGCILADSVHLFSCDSSSKALGFVIKPNLAPLAIIEQSLSIKNIFDLYPNPANQILNLKFSAAYLNEKAGLKVFDIQGSVVYKKNIKAIGNEEEIECHNWKSGTYIVQITINNKIKSAKQFIKQ